MESKVNIYIYLSILIIILMIISIFIQILLMKRIFYSHRDFLEVGERNNRASKDPIGISQPIIPENSNESEQSYVSLKEHKEVSIEETPVMKNDKKLSESQAKGEQEALALKLKHQANVDSVSKKLTTDKTHLNDENLNIKHKLSEKSGIYSQNSHSKKNPHTQYNTIVLDQNSSTLKKEKKLKKESIQLSEGIKTVVEQKTEAVDQPKIVYELHEDSLSKVDVNEKSSSIENFVKKDLEQQVENNQVALEVDSMEAPTHQDNLVVVHPIDKIEEDIIQFDTQKNIDELSTQEKNSMNTGNDSVASSLSGGLADLDDEMIKSEFVEGQNFSTLQIKANDVLDVAKNDIQELIGLENILRTDHVITDDSDTDFEFTLPKQIIEEKKPEQQPLEKESFKNSNEQSLAIEKVSINQVAEILVEEKVDESLDSIDTQALLNVENVNNTDEIIFFAGINSDLIQQSKHDPLSDILKLEKGILQSLGIKQESDDSKNNGIEKNKTNKLKLFDNVVKKLTTLPEDVDSEATVRQINPEGHEISMDGIRDTYERILNSYK